MINIVDSLKLARIKFKNRKLRNLFSGCTISLGIIIIMVVLLASAGILNIARRAFKDSISGRYFTVENYNGFNDIFTGPSNSVPTKIGGSEEEQAQEQKKKADFSDEEKYKKKNEKYNIKKIYKVSTAQANIAIDGIEYKPPFDSGSNSEIGMSITRIDGIFIDEYLNDGYTFEDKYNGAIPVVLPKSLIINKESSKNISDLHAKERFDVYNNSKGKYLGKTFSISQLKFQNPNGETTNELYSFNNPNTKPNQNKQVREKLNTKIIVVGFINDFSMFNNDSLNLNTTIVIPNWSADKFPEISNLFVNSSPSMISEFDTKSQRDDFVNSAKLSNGPGDIGGVMSRINPILGKFEGFAGITNTVKKPIFGVGGFFLLISALFIFTTLAKIVSDSRKEIGVFRAVGAQKNDIKRIFFSYAFLLSSLGFIIGTIISLIFNAVISIFWGDEIFYQIADMGTNTNFTKPLFVFIGFPGLPVIVLYIFTLLVGFLASYLPARKASRIDPIIALREG